MKKKEQHNSVMAYFLVFGLLLLSACASPAEVANMTINESEFVESYPDTQFSNTLFVVDVFGGENTNPLWTSEVGNAAFRSALENSLKQSSLSSPSFPDARFDVTATLDSLTQPLFGLDLRVTSRVLYRVRERQNRKLWFDAPVVADYVATFGDSPLAVQRLRLANEGSIRENIRQFIKRLLEIKPPS